MMTDTAIDTLNELIATLKDGEKGYLAAFEDAKRADLKELFSGLASQRAQFAKELQTHVAREDADVEDSGTIGGALHRGWIDLKSAVADREDKAILEECERGDSHAVKTFNEALTSSDLGPARTAVEGQYRSIQASLAQIQSLHRAL
jgi:uncharacterized protein (TIGR02284 family)